MNPYEKANYILHIDHHLRPEAPCPGLGLSVEKSRAILRKIRPDVVQVHSKGLYGYATYPTKVGTPHPNLKSDTLGVWRDAARAEGVGLFVYAAGFSDRLAPKTHPEWSVIKCDGKPWTYGIAEGEAAVEQALCLMCINNGFVEADFYPMLEEIIREYDPDGFWVDGETGCTVPCWCDACVEKFVKKTGMQPPRTASDPGVIEMAEFGRQSYRDYVKRTADFIHSLSPRCLYASTGAFSEIMPETVIDGVGYLTGDMDPKDTFYRADYRARSYRIQNRPFDVMLFDNGFAWDARPMQPKTPVQLCQEFAGILAHNGKASFWLLPNEDSSIKEIDVNIAARVGEFIRERESLLEGCTPVDEAYILNSCSHAYHVHDGFQNDGLFAVNKWVEEMRGAHRLMFENHYQFSIATEDHLRNGIPSDIKLLVIPEQGYLPSDIVESIKRFAEQGGSVVASGNTFVYGDQIDELRDLFGISIGEKISTPVGMRTDLGAFIVPAAWWKMEANACAEEVDSLYDNLSERAGCAAVTRKYGKGRLLAIAGNVFTAYQSERHPMLRRLLTGLFERVMPEPMVVMESHPGVSCIVSRRGSEMIMHLINRTSRDSSEPSLWYIDQPGVTGDIKVKVLSDNDPCSVTMPISGKSLEWQRRGSYIEISVPGVDIHEAVVFHS